MLMMARYSPGAVSLISLEVAKLSVVSQMGPTMSDLTVFRFPIFSTGFNRRS